MSWVRPARHAMKRPRGAMRVMGIRVARFKNSNGRRRLDIKIGISVLRELGIEPLEPTRVLILLGSKGTPQEGMAAVKIASEKEILFQTTWKLCWKKDCPGFAPMIGFPVTSDELVKFFPRTLPSSLLSYQTLDYAIQDELVAWELP